MTPELRFPEFQELWRDATAGDAFEHSKTKGEAGLPIWSVTLDRGMVPRDSLNRHMESDAADETNLRAQPGDLVYNMMRMWQGAVGQASEECMVSPAYVVLSPKPETCSRFFDYWLKAPHMLHRLKSFSHGLTKDRLRLYYADFAKIPIPLPCEDEQIRIADFMDSVSEKIVLLKREKAALEDYKRGLTQRLFSQELRFSRSGGIAFPEWREAKFGDLFCWAKTNSLSREHLTDSTASGVQNIHYGDIHGKFRALFRHSAENVPFITESAPLRTITDEEYLREGDIVIADASEDYADIGKSVEIMEVRERSMIAGLHTYIARPEDGTLMPGFAGYLLRSEPMRRQITRIAQGISVLGVSRGNLEKLTFWLPHPDEQRKIAGALMAVDGKIDAVSNQIAHMETFKKGLLQKMFV